MSQTYLTFKEKMPNNIKRMLANSISVLFEQSKHTFTKEEFHILYVSIFGDDPLDQEIKFLFETSKEVDIKKIESYFKFKMDQYNETDLHVLEMFRNLDKETKCVITAQDIVEAWNENKIYFSLEQVLECFKLIASEENVLDYFSFRNLYRENLIK